MEQVLSMLMSVIMMFVQFVMSFIGGGGTINPVNPVDPDTPETPVVEEYRWPLNKASYVTEGFPNYKDGTYHGGVDIVLSKGDSEGEPFYAVKDGKVTISINDNQDNLGYGNCVMVAHSGGISSFYAQAKSIAVEKDASVKKGDLLGYVGKTGNAKSAHLHLEIWKESNGSTSRVNPLDYVKNPYEGTSLIPGDDDDTSSAGSFNFSVFGYGHGVGMSQDGAIALAKNGYTYKKILTYYYPGTTIKTDSKTPETIVKDKQTVSILEFLCKTVERDIGSDSPLEAIKAQAVASYTYAKVYGYGNGQAYNSSFKYSGTKVEAACLEVLGMSKAGDKPTAYYVDYKGNPAQTFYFANAAGKTTSSVSVWGGDEIPYLAGGVSSPESQTKSSKSYTDKEMKALIEAYAVKYGKTAKFDSDPSKWIQIVSHDGSLGDKGYVTKIKVAGITMTGNEFRSKVLNYGLKSHCFTVNYVGLPVTGGG